MVIEELQDKLIAIRNKIWKINLECDTNTSRKENEEKHRLRREKMFLVFLSSTILWVRVLGSLEENTCV
jgi:hypothetical protein